VFALPADTMLDDPTLRAILHSGFSRFLVHAPGNVQAIKGLVVVKELVLIDADDKVGQLSPLLGAPSMPVSC